MVQPTTSRRHELSPLHAGDVIYITHGDLLYGPQPFELSRVNRYSTVVTLIELTVDEAEAFGVVTRNIGRVLTPPPPGAHQSQ